MSEFPRGLDSLFAGDVNSDDSWASDVASEQSIPPIWNGIFVADVKNEMIFMPVHDTSTGRELDRLFKGATSLDSFKTCYGEIMSGEIDYSNETVKGEFLYAIVIKDPSLAISALRLYRDVDPGLSKVFSRSADGESEKFYPDLSNGNGGVVNRRAVVQQMISEIRCAQGILDIDKRQ